MSGTLYRHVSSCHLVVPRTSNPLAPHETGLMQGLVSTLGEMVWRDGSSGEGQTLTTALFRAPARPHRIVGSRIDRRASDTDGEQPHPTTGSVRPYSVLVQYGREEDESAYADPSKPIYALVAERSRRSTT